MNRYAWSISLVLATALAAQGLPLPHSVHRIELDSAHLSNTGPTPRVVFRKTVAVSGAAWIRLRFHDDTSLPAGSRLRLTSRADGDHATIDAAGLRRQQGWSGFFNGDAVEVELVAAAGSVGNRARIAEAFAGEPTAGEDTICGADNRVPSQDTRVARFNGGCTAFMIGPATALTAAHCAFSGQPVLEFQVPPSQPNGQIVFAAQQDQYVAQVLAQGGSAEWCVLQVLPNTTTGLLPPQRYGSGYFTLAMAPIDVSGVRTRVTGYGSSQTRPLNQVQQTDVGPLSFLWGYGLHYSVDTRGGSSGSPVIWDNTGLVIGIHTGGGCSSVGGANHGVLLSPPGFQHALAQSSPPFPGDVLYYGNPSAWSCPTSLGPSSILITGLPEIGQVMTIHATRVPAASLAVLVAGLSWSSWGGQPLPLSFGNLGYPICELAASPDAVLPVSRAAMLAGVPLAIPNDPALVSIELYFQTLVAESSGIGVSLAARVIIGG